ncbi:AraC family transcriptional regulator ligand-binding domain-containing protein [Haliea sp. E17]|uniref:AraC family transcriptional regulator ligand-binding domain-containing protein n=1 Tax=Haliea sp. E17 TaxID=3401576 RepID=UPI003AAC9E63
MQPFVPNFTAPEIALPPQGRIRVGYLSGLTGLVSRLGEDPRRILEFHDIDPLVFDDPDRDIECITAVNLLEHCANRLQDPLFGMHLAELQDPDVYGCALVFARAAPNVREALNCLIDYVQVSVSPECAMDLVTGKDVAELRWNTHIGVGERTQIHYHGILLILKILQKLDGANFRPSYASLTCNVARGDSLRLQERLGCRVHGRAQANAIAFSSEFLDRPLPSANRMLFALLGGCMEQLRNNTRVDFVEQVESSVRRALSAGQCSLDNCADNLGTSTRTLQKRLTRMGIKFSEIVQNERIKLAKHALLWSDCSLDEIAFQLGYAEQTSFGRAFKRATGLTPKSFRLSERPAGQPAAGF